MITVLYGPNQFAIDTKLAEIVAASPVAPERLDGESISLSQLSDIFQGTSLFSQQRLIVIRGASANRDVWEKLATWLEHADESTHLVFIENKLDKRTKTFKSLKAQAKMHEYQLLPERDLAGAVKWLMGYAAQKNIAIEQAAARALIGRVGIDQARLVNELERLHVMGNITLSMVDIYTPAPLSENVFQVLGLALAGESGRIVASLATLARTADAYQTSGLLASQVFWLACLSLSTQPVSQVAKDIKASPYALNQLAKLRPSREQLSQAVQALAQADRQLKSTNRDPWLVLEVALLQIANQANPSKTPGDHQGWKSAIR